MSLPVRTTLDDIGVVCKYLASKPTGATLAEAKKVLNASYVDGRKLSALKHWGLVEEGDGEKLKLTERGRLAAKNNGADLKAALLEVVRSIAPYTALVERAAHSGEESMAATEAAAYWHNHFDGEVADSDKTLNEQVVCFFQVLEGSGLGQLTVGRKGSPTRITFNKAAVESFAELAGSGDNPQRNRDLETPTTDRSATTFRGSVALPVMARGSTEGHEGKTETSEKLPVTLGNSPRRRRVFITHGKNRAFVEPLKKLLGFGELEAVVAIERESVSLPVPDKVMNDMRACGAAIIHVEDELKLIDGNATEHIVLNPNVLIEIGAAIALYGRRFILLVKDGVKLPSNLQGLCEVRYPGEALDGNTTLKLLEAIRDIKNYPLPDE